MNNVLKFAETSLVKWVVDQIAAIDFADIEYVELDARSELSDASLPDKDIAGLTQFAIADDDRVFPVHFMVGVSTKVDENLFRLRDIANHMYNRLQTGMQIPYYNADTQALLGQITIIPGTNLLPTSRVETRPFRFIQVHALLDPLLSV
jgi:hypothetical protein